MGTIISVMFHRVVVASAMMTRLLLNCWTDVDTPFFKLSPHVAPLLVLLLALSDHMSSIFFESVFSFACLLELGIPQDFILGVLLLLLNTLGDLIHSHGSNEDKC